MDMNWERFLKMEEFGDEKDLNEDLKYTPVEGPEGDATSPLVVVSREEWGALPPKSTVPITRPPWKVVYTMTTRQFPCYSRHDCIEIMQHMQKEHMEVHGFSDIAYNFLVGRDGTIYEGRGWHVRSCKNLKHNMSMYEKRLDIGFIGDFSTEIIPPINMLEGALNLGIYGMKHKYLVEPYKLIYIRNCKERRKESIRTRTPYDMMVAKESFYPPQPIKEKSSSDIADTPTQMAPTSDDTSENHVNLETSTLQTTSIPLEKEGAMEMESVQSISGEMGCTETESINLELEKSTNTLENPQEN